MLHLFEADSLRLWSSLSIRSEQQCSLHRSTNSTSNETIQPVVVGLFGAGFPFVDRSAAAFGFDEVFGGDLFGEHTVLVGAIAEDGKTSVVAHRDGEPCVCERLPPVRVVDDVADGAFAVDGRDSPIQTDAIT
nr:hypothetical protein [Rubripirellula amarantea]